MRFFRPNSGILLLSFVLVVSQSARSQDDALRQFFAKNNRLVLVNPFPASLPMGLIMRPENGELREIDRDCFSPFQTEIVPQESYDFMATSTTKKRGVTAGFLEHIGHLDVSGSQKVSIDVVGGRKSIMPESRFSKIIESTNFPPNCIERVRDQRNYIVYEVVTGRLVFKFWKKFEGKWQVNPITITYPLPVNREAISTSSSAETDKKGVSGIWETTKDGGIQMEEPRVLAVHARRWKPGRRNEFSTPMSMFQFSQIRNLNWKLISMPGRK